jgi:hypothetical protein
MIMNHEMQIKLSKMTLEEFRVWYSNGGIDCIPVFFDHKYLATFEDPVAEEYKSVLRWVDKYPYPEKSN